MSHWSKALVRLRACEEAVLWAATQPTQEAAWLACERPEWMIWIAHELGTDDKLIHLAAVKCARLALPYVTPGEERPRLCIEAAERYLDGTGTLEQMQEARRGAWAATAAAYAAYAADATAAAAVYAAGAGQKMHAACCDEIRKVIPSPMAKLELRP